MTVCRIEHDNVDLCFHKGSNAVQNVSRSADSRAAEQTAAFVSCRVRVLHSFFNIFNRDEALQIALFIDNRKLFDSVVAQDLLCILEGGTDRRGDEVILRHDVFDFLVEIGAGHEAQVAVRDDADELAVFADRHAGDLVAAHEVIRLAHGVLRRKEERINDNAVLGALDHIDLIGLTLNGHVLVNDADAALTRNGNGHIRFRDGIHSRRHNGGVQLNLLCEMSGNVYLTGQYV